MFELRTQFSRRFRHSFHGTTFIEVLRDIGRTEPNRPASVANSMHWQFAGFDKLIYQTS